MKRLLNVVMGLLAVIIFVEFLGIMYMKHFSKEIYEDRIQDIFQKVYLQSGQTQFKIPLRIVKSNIVNAGTDGKRIVMFTGLAERLNRHQIAFVLAHELAHINLRHNAMLAHRILPLNELEAHADKMGAVYMMKAGYDICKGREFFKVLEKIQGNSLNQNHPSNAYRYNELNIGCE